MRSGGDRDEDREAEARERYERELIERGQAAEEEGGKLPPRATHEIIEDPDDPTKRTLRRRRFRLF